MDWNAIRHFTREEMACRCGCGRADMDPDYMHWLDELRESFGEPIIVTSGYRCPDHNEDVSSTGRDGPHTTGKAVDVAVSHEAAYRLLDLAMRTGASGVGVNQKGSGRFLHLDRLAEPRPRVWSY